MISAVQIADDKIVSATGQQSRNPTNRRRDRQCYKFGAACK
jgi:hypothetical protein